MKYANSYHKYAKKKKRLLQICTVGIQFTIKILENLNKRMKKLLKKNQNITVFMRLCLKHIVLCILNYYMTNEIIKIDFTFSSLKLMQLSRNILLYVEKLISWSHNTSQFVYI